MNKQLPERPNLEHLREQAKDLLSAFRKGDPDAIARMMILPSFATRPDEVGTLPLALHDAQSVVAREYGFPTWPKLVNHVEQVQARFGITAEVADRFIELALSDRIEKLRQWVDLHPGLPRFDLVCSLVSGETALVQKWLAGGASVGAKLPPNDWTPLEYVCYSKMNKAFAERSDGLLESARLLLDAGADPNAYHLYEGAAKLSVLYGASGESFHLGIVRLLLQRGAHPNDGESVYHAAQHDQPEIMEELLAHGADISGTDPEWNNTPLFFLAGYRESDSGAEKGVAGMRWLLEHGADPNIPSGECKETPLHAVCRTGMGHGVVEMLLRHGADPLLARSDGRTAYALARLTGNRRAVEALRQAGSLAQLSETDEFLAACAEGNSALAREMQDRHPGLMDGLGKFELSLLAKLAELGIVDGVRTMLEVGFDVATRGESGATALHFASFCGWHRVVALLLDHAAPLDVLDSEYQATPLGWALHGLSYNRNPGGDYLAVVAGLLAAGASKAEVVESELPEDLQEPILALVRG